MINVLIVDDSSVMRQLIRAILESDPELRVVGEAANGKEAIRMCVRTEPDIITMDLNMPEMDGCQAARHIMAEHPRPIIMLTSSESITKVGASLSSLQTDVLLVTKKPRGIPGRDPSADKLILQVKAMAKVSVVRRKFTTPPNGAHELPKYSHQQRGQRPIRMIAIGASTGGPPAICSLLNSFPIPLSVPVAVVQHISHGFIHGMTRWLNDTTPYEVKVVDSGELLLPGKIYMAPDERHFEVMANTQAWLVPAEPVDGHRPSATQLFQSVAKSFGSSAMGILLTGMGRDGALGLKAIREAGGHTIAQNEESCVVFGMPKEAIKLGAAMDILPLDQIGRRLGKLLAEQKKSRQIWRSYD